MKTLHLRITSAKFEEDPALLQAAEILRRGGLVAFPTETVYGLGANALNAAAVGRIFQAKQRPHWDPVIVHVTSVVEARRLTSEWRAEAERLAAAYWPGPLTMLLPRADEIPLVCTAGRDKVGLRWPSHPVAQALIRAAGVPVAAPSANRFGHTSPTTAEHVLADLDGRIDAVLDGGPCTVGVESTVLDPGLKPPVIYRPGGITPEQVRRVLGEVTVAQRKVSDEAPPESLESPGLGIRHYAPRARVLLVESQEEFMATAGRELSSGKVGVLLPREWTAPDGAEAFAWGSWDDAAGLARGLYDGLRVLDEKGVAVIVCPLPPAEGIGLAVRDRLLKAAK
ncbi:MAG: L-threonylcarbamoyladenylate synthase [Acidobacteriota bacterium]|nr:L-threonylcarbamoyladenylate synthase [Acidobacteriota bacterium]